MKTRRIIAGMAAASFLLLGGCYSAPVMPPGGFIFQNTDALVGPPAGDFGARRGESSAKSILGMIAWGDASAKKASDNGGIQQLKHIDYSFFNFLGVFQKFTTVAYGD